MYEFKDLLGPRSVSPYIGVAFQDINEAGQILGLGYFRGAHGLGAVRSFIATPVPEPATTALMLAGLAAVGFAAWRRSAVSGSGRPA